MKYRSDQDVEDHDEERIIQEWLRRDRPEDARGFECRHIGRKGNVRNTHVKSALSLDQKVREKSSRSRTYGDIIAGFDGRALEDGNPDYHFQKHYEAVVKETLESLGFKEGEIEWIETKLKSSESMRQARSRKSQIDSESWELLTNYEK